MIMNQLTRTLGRAALAAPALLLFGAALPQETGDEPIYDPGADARAAVTRATEIAAKKHKRVLVVWGHDAHEGDVDLHTALRRGKTKDWPFYYEYELVAVDVGVDGASNADLALALGASGTPALTVLDAAGKPLANQVASAFRVDGAWQAEALGRFLAEHTVEPLDAEAVMREALARAEREQKRLFVHLGAPW